MSADGLRHQDVRPGSLGIGKRAAGLIRRFPLASASVIVMAIFALMTIGAPLFATHDYDEVAIVERLSGPSTGHWFGTDELGRDVYSRVVYGGRVSFVIGFSATLVAAALSASIGMISGYFGGWFDLIIQRFVDIWMAFPGLVFVLFIVAAVGISQPSLILVLGVLFGGSAVRIIRSAVLTIRGMPYIVAARSTGASELRILLRHVLPGVAPYVIVVASVQVGGIILAESSLAFLGFGAPPPTPSWGRMLQEAQVNVVEHPYLAVFPGFAIAASVYAFNMIGDAIRDGMDPRLRNR